jgi:hypothetical protein
MQIWAWAVRLWTLIGPRGESRSIEFDGWLAAHPADVFEHFEASFLVDGVIERMIKSERAAVRPVVRPQEATVTIRDRLARGISFEATAAIRVLDKDVRRLERCCEGRGPAEGPP